MQSQIDTQESLQQKTVIYVAAVNTVMQPVHNNCVLAAYHVWGWLWVCIVFSFIYLFLGKSKQFFNLLLAVKKKDLKNNLCSL